jgi:hypothetical protein
VGLLTQSFLERLYRSTEALIVSAGDTRRLILSTVPSTGIEAERP